MTSPAFTVQPMTPDNGDAWLHFFDSVAFADNPRWAACYCQFPTFDHGHQDWRASTAQDNRARACQRIASGRQSGVLALAEDAVVGWCHAGAWTDCRIMDDAPEPLAERLGAITCFVVAPAWRGRGVATALLAQACALLQAQGFEAVDAWADPAAGDAAAMHTGPMSMFEAAGFAPLRQVDGRWLMRRHLKPR